MAFDPKLRSPHESTLFTLGVIFSSLVWLALVITVIGFLYGLIGLSFVLCAHALYLAHIRGNGVRLSERQLPELHARIRAISEKLGLQQVPEVYVIQAGGVLNAFATKMLSRKYVILYSDLLDQCRDPRQLDFVIGHEVGHLAAGHLAWNAFLLPFQVLPWLGPAYSRAREYTCDRCGYYAVGDLEQSMRGLVVLAAGGKVATHADLDAFIAQLSETGDFWMAVLELSASHPYLCKRTAALQRLSKPDTVAAVRRNPFAWFFAPISGAFAVSGSVAPLILILLVMFGAVAAIVPSFLKYPKQLGATAGQQGATASSETLTAEDRESLEWLKQVRQQLSEDEDAQ